MSAGTNGKLCAAAIRTTGILVGKLNIALYCCFVIPSRFAEVSLIGKAYVIMCKMDH